MGILSFKCILCHEESQPKLVNDIVKGDKKNALKVVSCPSCSHIQLHPPLYSLQHYNQDDQVNFVIHDYGTPLERIIET
jgi:DNA-directed RNA polymerase subunit RPC12/RpoP